VNFKKPLQEEAPFIQNKDIDSRKYHEALRALKEQKK
jgi:hypothetical protein